MYPVSGTPSWLYEQIHKLIDFIPVTFTLPKASETIIVLSQSDDRFYKALSSSSVWTFDFKIFKRGTAKAVANSDISYVLNRSSKLRIDLEAGDYVVHVRLDRTVDAYKVRFDY